MNHPRFTFFTIGLLAACLLTGTANIAVAQTAAPAQSLDVDKLRQQIADEMKQLDAMQKTLAKQQQQLDAATKAASVATPAAAPVLRRPLLAPLGDVASTSPMVPLAAGADQMPADEDKSSPLQFKIGNASITPVGFMDFIGVFRSTNPGTGLGTNFGGIPVNTPTAATAHLTEANLSAQNSRVGFRVDANYKGYQVLGYLETDFLGNAPAGLAVTSNGDTLRLRLFSADIKKDKWEIAGGQMWSMLTPSRNGIGILPGDLFYSQDIDTNYQVGLTWSRDPGFRVIAHPDKHVSLGVSLEESQQYMGGNNGGGKIVLPSALSGLAATQLDDGSLTGFQAPTVIPDVIAKAAFDGKFSNGNGWHFELAGLYRDFKIYDTVLATPQSFTANGGAGQFNFNVELVKGFRLIANNYYGTGGGRYMMGQAPDLMVNSNGTLTTIKSGSTLDGFEYTKESDTLRLLQRGVHRQAAGARRQWQDGDRLRLHQHLRLRPEPLEFYRKRRSLQPDIVRRTQEYGTVISLVRYIRARALVRRRQPRRFRAHWAVWRTSTSAIPFPGSAPTMGSRRTIPRFAPRQT